MVAVLVSVVVAEGGSESGCGCGCTNANVEASVDLHCPFQSWAITNLPKICRGTGVYRNTEAGDDDLLNASFVIHRMDYSFCDSLHFRHSSDGL